ncbi:hypothetical protein E4U21_004362 [Claviceps maximensis]|nr:hypothetical protein E4U21_004362 [Claviceps maximensis]
MKTTFTALGMLVAVASAYGPGRVLHFRRNDTQDMTTLSFKTTHIHTIISCAPTITNCPAHATDIATLPDHDKITKVITDTDAVSTTVCSSTDAAQISSSVLAKAASSSGPAPTDVTTTVTNVVTSKTYTMVMGTGPGASVATRTIRTTSQMTLTIPNTGATAAPAATSDRTTTEWATTKVTRTVVLHHKKPTSTAGNSPATNTSGGCPVSTVTETVTVPAPTVYVTVGACTADQNSAAATQAPAATSEPIASQPTSASPTSTGDDCDDYTPTLRPTATAAPYPSSNGTHPTSGQAKPTGFARLHR